MQADINLTPTATSFQLPDKNIIGRTWGTPSECWAAAILIHGLGANSGWFEALGRRLKVRGMYALAYDQIGFGRQKQEPLHSYKQWLDMLEDVYALVNQHVKDKPVFLLGNSMGALVSAGAAGKIQPSGLIWFSPGFAGHPACFTLGFRLKALLQAVIFPQSKVRLPYPVELITRNQQVYSWLENDPDYLQEIPAGIFLELLKLSGCISKQYKSIETPLLLLTAGQDRIVDNRVSQRVYRSLGSSRKKQLCYAEAWHDLMFDPELDAVVDEIAQWMSLSLPEKSTRT